MSTPSPAGARIEARNLSFGYHDGLVVENVSLTFEPGSISCLLGPSGCGKTTLLRLLAGFETPNAGEIMFNGARVSSARQVVPPEARRIGMVFQDFALFPHLNVADNITFALTRTTSAERIRRLQDLLALTGLKALASRFPHELSGGQQQRVALARALAPRPQLVLLDEPFASLDVELRARLASEIRDILKTEATTAVLVTHDQQEAFAFADRTAVLREGRVHQFDSGQRLYHEPATRFVAQFVGEGAFLQGHIVDNHIDTALGALVMPKLSAPLSSESVEILVRPDDLRLQPDSSAAHRITSQAFRGPQTLLTLTLSSGEKLLAVVPSHMEFATDARVAIHCDMKHTVLFARTGS